MAIKNRTQPPVEFIQALAETGLDDIHLLRRQTAERVLTEQRELLLKEIQNGDVKSVRDLARRVDRNVSVVSRDLDVLFEADIVEFERDGRAKKPRLAHDTVLVEPLVFKGEVRSRD